VFAMDMARGRNPIPLISTPQYYENGAVFSPDGKWLAFLSGKAEIYMQAIDRGGKSLRVTAGRFRISSQGAQC
jgi:hypothetical protein